MNFTPLNSWMDGLCQYQRHAFYFYSQNNNDYYFITPTHTHIQIIDNLINFQFTY